MTKGGLWPPFNVNLELLARDSRFCGNERVLLFLYPPLSRGERNVLDGPTLQSSPANRVRPKAGPVVEGTVPLPIESRCPGRSPAMTR